MVNFQKVGVGGSSGPHGGPKGPKMANIVQYLEFFGFYHHPFHSGEKISLLLHWSNSKRVVETESREWRTLEAQQRGPPGAQQWGSKGPKIAEIDQNLEFFLFRSHPIHSSSKFSLFLHWYYAGGVVENDRRVWGPLRGPPGGPKAPKMASGWIPQGSISAIFGLLGPPGGPPRGPHTRLSLFATPPG